MTSDIWDVDGEHIRVDRWGSSSIMVYKGMVRNTRLGGLMDPQVSMLAIQCSKSSSLPPQ